MKKFSNFKSWREKYKPAFKNDKLENLHQEIANLKIRNRNENDPDLEDRIKKMEKTRDELSKKYQDLAGK